MPLDAPMLKAVIFDMDGVIIDSEPFHWEVNKKIFKHLGITIADEEYRNFLGVSNTDMWTVLKRQYGLSQPVGVLVAMQVKGNIDFLRKERFQPIPGVVELIRNLKSETISVGLASSSPYDVIDIVLHSFGIAKGFDAVVSGEDFEKSKPAPDIFLKAADLLRAYPEQCTVIEDTTHGVAAAKAARMVCIGFANEHSSPQDLTKADLIVRDLASLNVQKIQSLTRIRSVEPETRR